MGRKFVAEPKNLMSATQNKNESASLGQLADVEKTVLNALEELAEIIAKQKNTKD